MSSKSTYGDTHNNCDYGLAKCLLHTNHNHYALAQCTHLSTMIMLVLITSTSVLQQHQGCPFASSGYGDMKFFLSLTRAAHKLVLLASTRE